MKRISVFFLILLTGIFALPVKADTIYLKNGSVLKGKVTSFSDDQFVVQLNLGNDRSTSKATIFIGDVARIEFDGSPSRISDSGSKEPAVASTVDSAPKESQPKEQPLRSTIPPDSASTQPKEPESAQSDKAGPVTPPGNDGSNAPKSSTRKNAIPGKTGTVDVIAKRDWTSTGMIVKRGDIIRITATGTITLDPNSGLTSGPEGTDASDQKKLMQDRPTGALIAVVGGDNDDFIFIGRSAEFTSTHDGVLFLSVNEGNLSDNAGSYKTTVEILPVSGK